MKSEIVKVDLPGLSGFAGASILATTPTTASQFSGGTPVLDRLRNTSEIAWWGGANQFPQDVIRDISTTSLMGAVIDRKVDMLVSGGLGYGTVEFDPATGQERIKPLRIPEIDDWMEDTNIPLYLHEAARDWYTFYNIFPELTMGRAKDRIVGIECKDASQMRLGTMDDKGMISSAYLGDWANSAGFTNYDAKLYALDPYFRVPEQVLQKAKAKYILPVRVLDRGQFYYGIAPWNGLRASGWLDVARRVPVLKMHLLQNLMHLRYHFEISELYWPKKYKDWDSKSEAEQLSLMTAEVANFDKWARGEKGQGGTYWSSMFQAAHDKSLESYVKINEMKMSLPEGAYLQDAQEADFIICRDLGLKPSLHGISPSKSGASAGSGSEDRVSRTNHILDNKLHADKILAPLNVVRKVNGWRKDIRFYFNNYYAATLDRTMQVGKMDGTQIPQ